MTALLQVVDSKSAALLNQQRQCHEGTADLLQEMTRLLCRVVGDYKAANAKVAATEKDKSDALERVTTVECAIGRHKFTLERALDDLVAEQRKRAALEERVHYLKDRARKLQERVHQLSADARQKVSIKLGGVLHSTKCSLCGTVRTGQGTIDEPNDELERDLIDALNRAAAAEQRTRELHNALHVVKVLNVDTNNEEQRLDEPAHKRLKCLEHGSIVLQAQTAETQVRIKREKEEVAEELEVSN